jgi:hypothetical protein
MCLLFIVAHWHGLAKLRLHTDTTLDILDTLTVSLGKGLREFNQNTCSAFTTRELQREANARSRKQAKAAQVRKGQMTTDAEISSESGKPKSTTKEAVAANTKKRKRETGATEPESVNARKHGQSVRSQATVPRPLVSTSQSTAKVTTTRAVENFPDTMDTGRQRKELNLNTYKHHALGDVANTIRRYGTTDSYSTEPVSVVSNSSAGTQFRSLVVERVSWSTALQSQGTCEQVKRITSSN